MKFIKSIEFISENLKQKIISAYIIYNKYGYGYDSLNKKSATYDNAGSEFYVVIKIETGLPITNKILLYALPMPKGKKLPKTVSKYIYDITEPSTNNYKKMINIGLLYLLLKKAGYEEIKIMQKDLDDLKKNYVVRGEVKPIDILDLEKRVFPKDLLN